MKKKVLFFVSEYFIFVAALVVLYFVFAQHTIFVALITFCSVSFSILIVWNIGAFLKFVVKKERPLSRMSGVVLRDRYAFPSMHSLTLGAATTYVSIYTSLLGVLLMIISLCVMFARVKTRMHDRVDVVMGFLLGVVFMFLIHNQVTKALEQFIHTYIG